MPVQWNNETFSGCQAVETKLFYSYHSKWPLHIWNMINCESIDILLD